LVAVDPKVIPLRTRLYVKGYGYAYAADTGSAIKGSRIDLAVKDKKEEIRFNRKKITVYILEKAKSW
jgi:3D (Asp-Asp-Asp) domain-containing protein